nr:alpha/beta fold hydrolase [Pseudoxanthomonas mexicana]
MVEVKSLGPGEYIAMKRGDILTTGRLSAATQDTVRVAGLDGKGPCATPAQACLEALAGTEGIDPERRLAALTELRLQQVMEIASREGEPMSDLQLDAWLEVGRHAYAYLFFSGRAPGERAFEDRQTQVRDYYNYAIQQATIGLFQRRDEHADPSGIGYTTHAAGWTIRIDLSRVRLPEGLTMPHEVVPAASLAFTGLRSTYRRDGFGAEVVAVMEDDPATAVTEAPPPGTERSPRRKAYSEMTSPALTVLIRYVGDDLDQVLDTREIVLSAYDPYRDAATELHGQKMPLAANYTAGYGLWLARSDFATQSLHTVLGREQGIDRPHLYLMQPYDPQRRIILMVHGLASSPEAWVNVANEILGDETLRQNFQVWQVYYPTNLPIAYNQSAIRRIMTETLQHFDPDGSDTASRGIVLIGHSMGGVLSRLLVSSSGDRLWNWLLEHRDLDDGRLARIRGRLEPMLRFEPFPGVERAIFIAAPHRGTKVAGNLLGRWISRLVRLPLTVLAGFEDVLHTLADSDDDRPAAPPNSIDNLSETDPFIQVAADLPISPRVRYHSIIAQNNPDTPLPASDDGLVPYRSAHLPGAASEKVIVSGHSVQEAPEAILEIRRILHEDLDQRGRLPRKVAQ